MPQNVYLQLLQSQKPNDAQVIAEGARGLQRELTESQKLQMAMQELSQRRVAALLAQRKFESDQADNADKKAEEQRLRDTRQKGREIIFKDRRKNAMPGSMPTQEDLALLELDERDGGPAPQAPAPQPQPMPGAPPPNPAQGGRQMPAQPIRGQAPAGYEGMEANMNQEAGFDPGAMSREEMLRTAGRHEMIEPKDYFTATDPTRDPQFVLDKLATQAGYRLDDAKDRQEFQWKMMQFLEGGRNKRAAAQDKAKPKTRSGMPLKPLGDAEAKKLSDIRSAAWNISKVRDLANDISSLKFGPIAGRAAGRNPYDASIKRLENAIRATVPSLARGVYGEVGVLTDQDVANYMALLPTIKTDPSVAAWIVSDLQDKIGSSWTMNVRTLDDAGRDVSGFDPFLTFDDLANMQQGGRGAQRAAPPAAPSPAAPGGQAPADTGAAMNDLQRIEARMRARKAGTPQ